jgi:hypothetical protein
MRGNMSKYGKYTTNEWPMSFKLTKTDSGGFKATVKAGPYKDKSWEGTSESEALKKAKAEIDTEMQKGNQSR